MSGYLSRCATTDVSPHCHTATSTPPHRHSQPPHRHFAHIDTSPHSWLKPPRNTRCHETTTKHTLMLPLNNMKPYLNCLRLTWRQDKSCCVFPYHLHQSSPPWAPRDRSPARSITSGVHLTSPRPIPTLSIKRTSRAPLPNDIVGLYQLLGSYAACFS